MKGDYYMNRSIKLKTSSEKRIQYWKKMLDKNKVEYTESRTTHIFIKNEYMVKFEVGENVLQTCLSSMLIPNEDLEFFYEE